MLAHALLGPFIAAWLRTSGASWRLLGSPGERQQARAAGPNADRVLLIGSGIAVGYGVASSDLALGGSIARAVSALTGRGLAVDTVAKFGLRVTGVPRVLDEFDLTRFDGVLLTLGTDEALHLVTARAFRGQLAQLAEWLDHNSPTRLGVALVGIPDITSIMRLPRQIRRLVKRQCARLDAEVVAACRRHERLTYLPFVPARANLQRDGDSRFYLAWAALLAPGVAAMLDVHVADPRDPATIQEARRQFALDSLEILDTPSEHRFDRIVADARRIFGVSGASITFIDRERQWSKAVSGMDAIDSPRGSALGDATVHNGKLFVVEDAKWDPRFNGHPWVAGATSVRFFAGFPIEAANGQRIGALCICDPVPRTFDETDDALLGVLAGQVQDELWGKHKASR